MFGEESKLFGKASKLNRGNAQYPGQQPGDIPDWKERYEYNLGTEVRYSDGNYYRCLEDHVSGDFFVDLGSGKWVIFAGPGINTDNQTLYLIGNVLYITGRNSIDLSFLLDNTDSQTLSLVGTILSIVGGNSVDLTSFLDNTDAQQISLDPDGVTLRLKNGTGPDTTVDLTLFLNLPAGSVIWSGSTGDSVTVSNTNAETNITTNGHSFTVPINSLKIGDRIKIKTYARYGTGNAIRNLQFRLKMNGGTLIGSKAIALPINQSNKGVWVESIVTIRTAGLAGTLIAGMSIEIGDSSSGIAMLGDVTPSVNTKAIDTTIANTFSLSVQWSGGAPSATNTITFEEIIFEKLEI